MTDILIASNSQNYTYDEKNQRIRKGNTRYVYDLAGHLLGEYSLSGQPIREYLWIGNDPVATIGY